MRFLLNRNIHLLKSKMPANFIAYINSAGNAFYKKKAAIIQIQPVFFPAQTVTSENISE
jgi:hypothetical protein